MLSHPRLRYGLILGACILSLVFLLPSSFHRVLSFGFSSGIQASETWYRGQKVKHPIAWQPPRDERLIITGKDLPSPEELAMTNLTTQPKIDRAAFVVLARNRDLYELLESIRGMEDRFNHKYGYPWIFLNNEPFSEEFKERTSQFTSGHCSYGLIDPSEWPTGTSMPENINVSLATEKINAMGQKPIPYGGSLTYRKMCRYQSMFFWRHPLLDDIEWYWRVEPSVKYYCDLDFDPFRFMKENKKKYGFVLSLYEYPDTIATLWETTKAFLIKYPQHLAQPNFVPFISYDSGLNYNQCEWPFFDGDEVAPYNNLTVLPRSRTGHFWSNFEIGDLSLWRSQAYLDYVKFLDNSGGFFYERWGDAPVHSIAASLFLHPDELHFFDNIGYFHAPFHACPVGGPTRNCACDEKNPLNFEFHAYSCTPHFKRVQSTVFKPAPPPPAPKPTTTEDMPANVIIVTKTVTID
ncbi:BQ2448_2512 [Microbotryum intermedium]|uniref:BQ2448_2512 protein n=1 Tax=Microbotryum intermedium TaxID=269621 RepID=A0A238F6M1_9BASI|nr:BQ2448_2512 [Microbotryum intermedium]